ncbi:helix-turn-helix domain-containing protein [Streptacidiphilus sp. ASG 303]|uniref:helix-turn-helix domain-containing protein n=1 Tax=Streptacidiphilus sp. ASG 303 TaxID=2896847 RepID=UPI001E5244DC|nr:helix-turn-helix transcriptional regulator [Streptacidiphilus sp. ASG 303]MCD0485221.1 helix-turn-helix domain-containing protein [Streptacidiphilus sp. ASG 303]
MASSRSSDAERPSVAAKLNHLIATRPSQSGRPYTNPQIVQGIADAAGPDGTTVSLSAIAQLRSGAKPNPTINTLKALARFFQVHPSYFLDDAEGTAVEDGTAETPPSPIPAETERVKAAEELLVAIKDNDVRGIAFRANGLSTDSLRMIKTVIEQARKLEGLDSE